MPDPVKGDGRIALFDRDDGGLLVLSDFRRTITRDPSSKNLADVASFFVEIEMLARQGEWIALAVDYELGTLLDSALNGRAISGTPFRAWTFGRGRTLNAAESRAFLADQVAALPEHERAAGVADLRVALDAEEYRGKIEQIRSWITEGDCYQINLTFPIDFRLFGHPLALYAKLRDRQPVRYGAFISTPEQTLLSVSPELFFERRGALVQTRPMKGTASRGNSPLTDDANRLALLASEKERAENVMIVDLLRNDLGRLAQPGKVRVDALCEAEPYPTLWQMVSTISAELPGVSLYDLFRALFPCGSITGAPKIAAMQKIHRLEASPRGPYTGALGWIAPDGDCRFNVAIRTLEIGANGRARLGVGSGIVIDADPVREYAECLLKARFLTGFDPGFELIETMRLTDGGYRFKEAHLERLASSAQALGFACDLNAISEALTAFAVSHSSGIRRVRLTLTHGGHWDISSAPLAENPGSPQFALLACEQLDPDDYLLRHKTTARSRYDKALRSLNDRPEVFDTIFFNARGEVCEGARSSVFIERDGKLLTPPLSCGLLPGVMRRHLLESGRAIERVLYREDLLGDAPVYLANALRGLIPIKVLT